MKKRGAHVGFEQLGHEHLEDENEQAQDQLRRQVDALKTISIDIGTEIRDQNKGWERLDNDFDSTFGSLLRNIERVAKLVKSGSRYHLFYLFLFCLFIFFVLWWMI